MVKYFQALWRKIMQENLAFLAGGVAFYALLSIAPLFTIAVMLYGLWASPADLQSQMDLIKPFMPTEVWQLINSQLSEVVARSVPRLSLVVVGSMLLVLLSASRGVKALIAAMRLIFDGAAVRKFWQIQLMSLALTLGAVVGVMLLVVLMLILPLGFEMLGISDTMAEPLKAMRWLVMGGLLMGWLTLLYRMALGPLPDYLSEFAVLRRIAPLFAGAAVGVGVWLAGSIGFSKVIELGLVNNQITGSLGAVVLLLLWLYASAWSVLIGAAVAAVWLERSEVV